MSNYIHGTHPEEQERLARMNELVNSQCLELLELKQGQRVLDVGSGPGQFTLAVAAKVGAQGHCIGIERDKNQLKVAQQIATDAGASWVEFRAGNVENLELSHGEWESFDVVHSRFVLEHVHQPESVVHGMAKAARSGGRVVVADDDHYGLVLFPEPPGFAGLWNAYIRSYDRLGNDPYIGRRLVSLLYQAGLRNIRNNYVFFGDNAGSPLFKGYADNLIGILTGAGDLLIKEGLISALQFDNAIVRLRNWAAQPDSALWYAISWASGVKP